MKKIFLHLVIAFFLVSCATVKKETEKPSMRLRFLGEYLLPDNVRFQNTRVGGLSGIDYNPDEDLYYLVSDDRSEHNDARFYTAKLFLSANGIDSLRFTSVQTLLQKNGKPYPGRQQDSARLPDPEGLRVNRQTGELLWCNEGERVVRKGYALLQDPSVNAMQKDGGFIETFPLPANMYVKSSEQGPRRNGAFEGLTFTPDFKTLYVSVEEPLYEDGPRAGLADAAAWVRFIRYNAKTKKPVAQYAYRLDAVVKEPVQKESFSINGVVDILAAGADQLLVTERSFSSGYTGCNVRIYLADLRGAENIAGVSSLKTRPPEKAVRKKILFNMDGLGREVYNIEGATFGPLLPNGKRSLLFVADDNFSKKEKTQLLLFEVD